MFNKIKQVNMIDSSDWDKLVSQVYDKVYCFQQQDDCKPRGIFKITVPEPIEEYYPYSIPYEINGEKMGVAFSSWVNTPKSTYSAMFWERNFYPDVQAVANDLYEKGEIPAGKYVINIDW